MDLASIVVHGPLDDLAQGQNTYFGRIDNWRGNQAAVTADRGDGEGAAQQILTARLAGAGSAAQSFDVAGNGADVLLIGVADDGHHQTGWRGHGDADVITIMQHDLTGLFIEASIDDRYFLKGGDDGLDEERQIRQFDAGAGIGIAQAVTETNEIRHVAFFDKAVMRDSTFGLNHTLGDGAAQSLQRDACAGLAVIGNGLPNRHLARLTRGRSRKT